MERKEEGKLFADDMIWYIGIPKESTKKNIELINTFSKIAGYKINIQKSFLLLQTITRVW